jgi:hypothetical protein
LDRRSKAVVGFGVDARQWEERKFGTSEGIRTRYALHMTPLDPHHLRKRLAELSKCNR